MEELRGPLAENIQQLFLLPPPLARWVWGGPRLGQGFKLGGGPKLGGGRGLPLGVGLGGSRGCWDHLKVLGGSPVLPWGGVPGESWWGSRRIFRTPIVGEGFGVQATPARGGWGSRSGLGMWGWVWSCLGGV